MRTTLPTRRIVILDQVSKACRHVDAIVRLQPISSAFNDHAGGPIEHGHSFTKSMDMVRQTSHG